MNFLVTSEQFCNDKMLFTKHKSKYRRILYSNIKYGLDPSNIANDVIILSIHVINTILITHYSPRSFMHYII